MKTFPTLLLAAAVLSLAATMNIQGAVSPVIVPKLQTVFTNPSPAVGDYFGLPVTAVGSNLVLIGAYLDHASANHARAAYLYSTSGTLLTTFTNPTPAYYDWFGSSLAAVGTDRVLIGSFEDDTGAYSTGAAYLFSTNGALLTPFTNPTPAYGDAFGWPVAAMGTDRVLIGASGDDTSATDAGAAYLFNTNGALIVTFTNPMPAASDFFGLSLAAVGIDRVLIGAAYASAGAASTGAAYLFGTNGALLTAFTNPTPAIGDNFGGSVAAVGTDRVLIGASGEETGAFARGAAYLFSTSGALIVTFTNPTPAASGSFGPPLAVMGTDRVLIGAESDDRGALDSGVVYLLNTNGALLTTFTNPTPAYGHNFGSFVVAVGTDQVLIGAHGDDTGASDAGAAYLFNLEPYTPPAPSLSTRRNPQLSTITISWPAPAEGWLLEGTNALPSVAASSWPPVPPPYQTNAGTISVTLTNSPATGNQFFRLRQP